METEGETRRTAGRRAGHGAVVAIAAIAVLTAASYMAWLGWDHEYQVDPATGVASGPYEAWQVIGLVVCLGLVAFVAGRRGRRGVCVAVMPIVLTVCFSIEASGDAGDDGLWVVGALLIFVGTTLGVVVAGGIAAGAARRFGSGPGRA